MSNYNLQLQSNNTDLQAILNAINELPEAGGEQVTPEISVDSSGLITATAGTKSSTHQLAFQSAKTITPSTASQIAVSSGYYTGGDIIVAAVPTQTKSVMPTSTAQNVTPDSGKFLSEVTVASIPSSYVKPIATKGATTYTPTTTTQTIASGTYLTGVQTIAGDSNLVAGNIKSGVSIFGVSGILEEGSSGGTTIDDVSKSLIDGTITEVSDDEAKAICYYAFYGRSKLTTVSFPAATTIGGYAFRECYKLTTVSFPAATTIGSYAFASCSSLTTASFPAATTISNYAFAYCPSLTTVSFPAATTIGGYAFRECYKLTTVSFPAATTIGSYAFYSCSSLTTASFPAATTIGSYAFQRCYNLSQLYLTGSSICTLKNSNAFSSTPYAGYSASFSGTPYIYVPQSLLTSYKTATNWTYFSSRFVGI